MIGKPCSNGSLLVLSYGPSVVSVSALKRTEFFANRSMEIANEKIRKEKIEEAEKAVEAKK